MVALAIRASRQLVLATRLPDVLASAYDVLSNTFKLDSLSARGLQRELQDAFAYFQGTDSERTAVIVNRLRFIDDRSARLVFGFRQKCTRAARLCAPRYACQIRALCAPGIAHALCASVPHAMRASIHALCATDMQLRTCTEVPVLNLNLVL